jgi:DnaJ-class molecular chaperone
MNAPSPQFTTKAKTEWIECEDCAGSGRRLEARGYELWEIPCDECEGTGGYFEDVK